MIECRLGVQATSTLIQRYIYVLNYLLRGTGERSVCALLRASLTFNYSDDSRKRAACQSKAWGSHL